MSAADLVEEFCDYSVCPLQGQGERLSRVGNVGAVHTHTEGKVALVCTPGL